MGVLHKNISQILAIIDFSSREIARETLSVRMNIVGSINLLQTSHLNFDKFGIGNNIPDCPSALQEGDDAPDQVRGRFEPGFSEVWGKLHFYLFILDLVLGKFFLFWDKSGTSFLAAWYGTRHN